MAIDTPARHNRTGDGSTKVFPIPTEIIGDDYIRIEIDGEIQTDRSLWDIVNNSVIFITAPSEGAEITFQVATSEEALSELGTLTNVDIVATDIGNINKVGNDLNNVNKVANNIDSVSTVADNINDVIVVSESIDNVNNVSTNINEVEAVASNEDNINIVAEDIDNVNTNANSIANINLVADAINGGAGIGGGQYYGNGLIKGIEYFNSESTNTDDITIVSGTNALSVDSFTIKDGASVTIEDGATWKVI